MPVDDTRQSMKPMEAVIDAAEFVLDELESREEVAYGEVGGVTRDQRDVVVRTNDANAAAPIESSVVWWRVFADGAAGYRHSTSFEEDHLTDMIERTIRTGQMLKQDEPASYDRGSVHRATHPGWGRGGRLDDLDPEAVAGELQDAVDAAVDGLEADLSRARVTYRDEHEEGVFLTTTGTTLHTTMERARTDSAFDSEAGKVQQHAGSTTGRQFLSNAPERLSGLGDRLDRLAAAPPGEIESGRRDVALSPAAGASLFHQLSHYLEMDTVYFGSSPFEIGDRIGPDGLTIEDVVRPGSFAARPFDAEGKPAQPTTLVEDGMVVDRLHDTASAIESGAYPSGTVVPAFGYEDPPRIHARHLDVAPGSESLSAIRADADVYVERFQGPRFGNEATHTKRTSTMPPSTLYAKQVAETTPSEYDDEADDQWLELPVEVAYTLDGDARDRRLDGLSLRLTLSDVEGIVALSEARATATGECAKNHSTLPWAATAPAVLLPTTVRTQ